MRRVRRIITSYVSGNPMYEFKNKKYVDLLFDALIAFDVASSMPIERSGPIYRAAIISSVVSLECAANICIDDLGLPEEIYSQVEKFSMAAKFDYFAYEKVGRLVDKSRNEYCCLQNIIAIRNNYVHPKVENGSWVKETLDASYGVMKKSLFDNDIRKWGAKEAEIVIDFCIKFLNYFFIELCKLKKGAVTYMLGCREVFLREIEVSIHVSSEASLLNHLKTKIEYLDLTTPNNT
jgi:hypothetical protein